MVRSYIKKLARFVKFCDYNLIDCKINLCYNQIDYFYGLLQEKNNPKAKESPLLFIYVDFGEN